jgi:hypothetical protein
MTQNTRIPFGVCVEGHLKKLFLHCKEFYEKRSPCRATLKELQIFTMALVRERRLLYPVLQQEFALLERYDFRLIGAWMISELGNLVLKIGMLPLESGNMCLQRHWRSPKAKD